MGTPYQRRLLESLAHVAYVDNRLAPEERDLLHRKAKSMGIPSSVVDSILTAAASGNLTFVVPTSQEARADFLNDVIDLITADGRLENAENRLLLRLGTQIGFEPAALGRRVRKKMEEFRHPPQRVPAPKKEKHEPAPPAPVKRQPTFEHDPLTVEAPPPVERKPTFEHDPLTVAGLPPTDTGPSWIGSATPGPVQIAAAFHSDEILPPVTLALVRTTLQFNGVDAAVQYLLKNCGIADEAAARALVEKIRAL